MAALAQVNILPPEMFFYKKFIWLIYQKKYEGAYS